MAAILLDSRGHKLAATTTIQETTIVCCLRCGAWATKQPRLLLKPCCALPSTEGKIALRRLASGFHPNPKRDEMISPLIPFDAGEDIEEWIRNLVPLERACKREKMTERASTVESLSVNSARFNAIAERIRAKSAI